MQIIWLRANYLASQALSISKLLKELLFTSYLLDYLFGCFQYLVVEDIGVEPMTLCVQGRCSSQLS